ncbi:flagellar filament capping protein FliD [Propionivibrio sp.]|uniref:flagellar filament capping protein FliD n=1 Tax=Propionivibrio sp. TaxID=2212460 RepID=UPI0026275D85|nr:flagellar filament capping protein FliD [Propionivibrio sp.]
MAISSPGLGSNLDVNSIVSQLMSVEQRPLTALAKKEAAYQAKISALGSLKGSISALQTAASNLIPSTGITAATKFTSNRVTVADGTILTASAKASAVAGDYTIEVTSLAKAQRLTSLASPALGSGDRTLTIETGSVAGSGPDGVGGGGAFSLIAGSSAAAITIGSGVTTLSGVADAINAASAGVTATVITSGSDSYLSLTSQGMGTGNVIRVTGDIASLNYDPSTDSGGLVQKVGDEASDAVFKLNGIDVTNSGNTITSVVQGLTINLLKEGTTNFSVQRDTSSLTVGVNAFVKAYNDFNTASASLGSYNAATKAAGVLNGDSTLRLAQSTLRSVTGSIPTGITSTTLTRLSDIGVNIQKDGSLVVDSSKLATAISSDFTGVANLVSAYGSAFKTAAEGLTSTGGSISTRTDGLNASIKSLDKQGEKILDRLTQIEARYRKQFTTLDTTISNLNKTSTYLTQQLANLPKIG